jgi:hypothetical protein
MGFSAFLISITDTDVRADRLPRLRSHTAARAHTRQLAPALFTLRLCSARAPVRGSTNTVHDGPQVRASVRMRFAYQILHAFAQGGAAARKGARNLNF